MGSSGNSIAKVGSFRLGNKLGEMTRLAFEVGEGLRGFTAAVNGF